MKKIRIFGNSNTDTNHIWEKELRPMRTAKCCVESKHISVPWEKLTIRKVVRTKFPLVQFWLYRIARYDRKLSFQISSFLIFKAKLDLLNLLVSHISPMLIYRMEIRKDILNQAVWVLGSMIFSLKFYCQYLAHHSWSNFVKLNKCILLSVPKSI